MIGQGTTIWITGLSGAGKTTLARELVAGLRAAGRAVVLLDGDELREVLGSASSNASQHDRDARLALAMQYSRLCKLIASQGVTVVIATISLFHEVHEWNRRNLPRYFEVYLKVPQDELRRRDPKRIYQRFDAGELTNVAGLDLAIDEPASPDLTLSFDPTRSVSDIAAELQTRLTSGRHV